MFRKEDRRSGSTRSAGRWAFAVLLVLVLGIWGVSQTLLPSDDDEREQLPYSEVKRLAQEEPERIEHLEFQPDERRIVVRFRAGTSADSSYPSDASAAAFERTLDEQGIAYSAEPGGESAWGSFLVYLVPFVLFFGFWIFLMRGMRKIDGEGGEREHAGEWWKRGG